MKHFFAYPSALLLGLALLAAPEAEAQQFSKRKQYNSVGVSLNAMNYFGDLVPKPSISSLRFGATRPNIGLSISRRLYPRVTGRLALAYGRLLGDDAKSAEASDPEQRFRRNRNMNFRNDILELSAVGIVDLIENRNTYLKRPDFVPYVFGGIAGFYHNPKGEYTDGRFVSLQPLGTEGQNVAGSDKKPYSKAQFSIPFGAGVRYRINRNFDASLEIGFRKTFTDYLDDVSTEYAGVDLGTPEANYFGGFGSNSITASTAGEFSGFGKKGGKRGTANEDDWYVQTGISLNYILIPRIKNPKFR